MAKIESHVVKNILAAIVLPFAAIGMVSTGLSIYDYAHEDPIVPGRDFPVEWIPEDMPNRDAWVAISNLSRGSELAFQKQAFSVWAEENGLLVDQERLDLVTVP